MVARVQLVLALLSAALFYSARAATVAGFDGAELGSTGRFSSSVSMDIATSPVRSGSYSYQMNNTSDFGRLVVSPSGSSLYVGIHYYQDTTGDAQRIFEILDSSPTEVAIFRVNVNNNLQAEAVGGTNQTGSTAIAIGSWNYIEFRYTAGTGSNAIAEVRLNGVVEATSTNGTATTNPANVDLEADNINTGANHYIDNVRFNDTGYPGEGFVVALRPDADDGTDDNFVSTGGDGEPSWNEVDDDPRSDSTYAEAPGAGSTPQLWDTTTQTVSTPLFAELCVFAARTNGQARTHHIRYRRATGTAQNSGDLGLSTSFAFYCFSPTDQPSSQAHVDDLHVGGDQDSAGGRLMQISEAYIMLDFQTAAPSVDGRGLLNNPVTY